MTLSQDGLRPHYGVSVGPHTSVQGDQWCSSQFKAAGWALESKGWRTWSLSSKSSSRNMFSHRRASERGILFHLPFPLQVLENGMVQPTLRWVINAQLPDLYSSLFCKHKPIQKQGLMPQTSSVWWGWHPKLTTTVSFYRRGNGGAGRVAICPWPHRSYSRAGICSSEFSSRSQADLGQ